MISDTLKKFIENNIELLEKNDLYQLFDLSLDILGDNEFLELYRILDRLDIGIDIDDVIHVLINDKCREITREEEGNRICIQAEWTSRFTNWLNSQNDIIDWFSDKFDVEYNFGASFCDVF